MFTTQGPSFFRFLDEPSDSFADARAEDTRREVSTSSQNPGTLSLAIWLDFTSFPLDKGPRVQWARLPSWEGSLAPWPSS